MTRQSVSVENNSAPCTDTMSIAAMITQRRKRAQTKRGGTAGRALAASIAQRAHLDRASEQLEFTERLPPGEQGVELGRLDILDPLAAHADDMMMRAGVAVVARGLVQRRDLARLADVAQALERAMDGGERDTRMFAADAGVDAVSARMVARFQQRAQHGKPLRRDRHLFAPAVGDEFREPGFGVIAASLPAKEFNFRH